MKPIVATFAVLLGCAAIMGTIACVDEVADRVDAEEADSQDDASIRDCGTDAAGRLVAAVAVTNDSSGTSTYFIDVDFVRDGRTVGQDDAIVSELAAGASAEVEAIDDPAADDEGVECRIAHVERFSD
jgi:hypothetical protein